MNGIDCLDFSYYFTIDQFWLDRESMMSWAQGDAFKHYFLLIIIKSWGSLIPDTTHYISIVKNRGIKRSMEKKYNDLRLVKPCDGASKKDGCPILLYGWEAENNECVLRVECGTHSRNLPPSLQGQAHFGVQGEGVKPQLDARRRKW